MANDKVVSIPPFAALVSDDESVQKLFRRACECCGNQPVIVGSDACLPEILHEYAPHQLLIDISLPNETITEFYTVRSKLPNGVSIPVTAVKENIHQSVSSRYRFVNGVTQVIDRSAALEDFTSVIINQRNLYKKWSYYAEEVVLDQKLQICMSTMKNLMKNKNRSAVPEDSAEAYQFQPFVDKIKPQGFQTFLEHLCSEISVNQNVKLKLQECLPEQIYSHAHPAGISREYVLQCISEHLMLPHISSIDTAKIVNGHFPPEFCRINKLLPLCLNANHNCLALGNPFDWELIEFLVATRDLDHTTKIVIIDPLLLENIYDHSHCETTIEKNNLPEIKASKNVSDARTTEELECNILEAAIKERATDIHIEPKENEVIVRFRVDGDLHDFTSLKSLASKLVCRFKIQAEMDISESRRPQDGCFNATILGRNFRIRVASTLTPHGESLTLRILETSAGLKSLVELGMLESQEQRLMALSGMHSGMLLFVGPTGSGKTTSLYSTLSHVDCRSRSLISVEDPIEYDIPYANQQQVNDKAGNSYEVLLKSSVRQDPDILFVGEIRDPNSARIAMDFTSTGRLTLTSLHTTNATTALFRLERLGLSRLVVSETVLAIIAQRLVKKLCNYCKKIMPINNEDGALLQSYFGNRTPSLVAYPSGCSRCNYTGYFERTGVFEVVHFSPEIADMVAKNRPISDIRQFLIARDDIMMPYHALEKIKDLVCSPGDILSTILLEEPDFPCATLSERFQENQEVNQKQPAAAQSSTIQDDKTFREVTHSPQPTYDLLLVEDDAETARLVDYYLKARGYVVDIAANGLDALLKLRNNSYRLIISDIMMPDLDGFKLLEILKQNGIEIPVILVTALSDEKSELHGFELGAVDYIHKPISLDILKMRIDRYVHN